MLNLLNQGYFCDFLLFHTLSAVDPSMCERLAAILFAFHFQALPLFLLNESSDWKCLVKLCELSDEHTFGHTDLTLIHSTTTEVKGCLQVW